MVVRTGALLTLPPKEETFHFFKEWDMEKLNMKFCKYIMGVSKTCTNIGIYSELGRFPLYIDMLKQTFMYWYRLEHSTSNLLQAAFNECKSNTINSDWYSSILLYSEKLNINLSHCKKLSENKFKLYIKKQLRNNFSNFWEDIRTSYMQGAGKLSTYFQYKRLFGFEKYLNLKTRDNQVILTKFRISNHCLRIETGRYEKKNQQLW